MESKDAAALIVGAVCIVFAGLVYVGLQDPEYVWMSVWRIFIPGIIAIALVFVIYWRWSSSK